MEASAGVIGRSGRGTSGRIWRIGLTAALTDLALYLVWVAVPYRAIALGANSAELGLLPAISSTSYVLTTLFAGWLSDRVPRMHLVRFGAVVFAGACLLILQSRSLGELLPRLPLMGLGMGFFWSSIQAALADEGSLDDLERNIGLFNVFWSGGKALGFLVGGSLYALFGGGPIFVSAAITMLIVATVLPRRRIAGAADAGSGGPIVTGPPTRTVSERDLRALLVMAWMANAVAFGIGNTMNIQYPNFLLMLGRGAEVFGLYLGAIFIVQTIVFWLLRTHHAWRFRRWPAYAVQVACAVSMLLLPGLHSLGWILLTAVPLGVGLGLLYHASIVYSLLDRAGRGRRAGVHEALLGVGNFLLPLLGGLAASAATDLRMPYFLCAGVALAAIGVQELLWRRGRA